VNRQLKPSFTQEQSDLADRVRRGDARFVYIDPDGTLPDWLIVVTRRKTGIVYGTQCAGVAVEHRFVEGYVVPLGGSRFDVDEGLIELDPFRDVFHRQENCQWSWTGAALPPDRLEALRSLIKAIPYWRCEVAGPAASKFPLRIDEARIDEIAEAWIPVETPDGPGVLLYKNCD
jgi:hypothetical protein